MPDLNENQAKLLILAIPGIMLLQGLPHRNMLCPMAESVQEQIAISPIAASPCLSKAKVLAIKIIALTTLGLALGFTQGWASSRYYGPKHVAGFHFGVLHGILMPATLPGLLMGNDLPIYAPNNAGRPYNIGFILGINFCGTVFFGISFWQPRKP